MSQMMIVIMANDNTEIWQGLEAIANCDERYWTTATVQLCTSIAEDDFQLLQFCTEKRNNQTNINSYCRECKLNSI